MVVELVGARSEDDKRQRCGNARLHGAAARHELVKPRTLPHVSRGHEIPPCRAPSRNRRVWQAQSQAVAAPRPTKQATDTGGASPPACGSERGQATRRSAAQPTVRNARCQLLRNNSRRAGLRAQAASAALLAAQRSGQRGEQWGRRTARLATAAGVPLLSRRSTSQDCCGCIPRAAPQLARRVTSLLLLARNGSIAAPRGGCACCSDAALQEEQLARVTAQRNSSRRARACTAPGAYVRALSRHVLSQR